MACWAEARNMDDSFDELDYGKTIEQGHEVVLGGRYRVVREVGRGGMGVVLLAEDTNLEDRRVAIKMLPTMLARNERAIRALKKEALVTIELTHPHIVTLRAFEQTDEGVFLVMDYVAGESLEERLTRAETLDVDEVDRVFGPIAEALDYAHGRKVVHRDVKPSNILIAKDGTPSITDFGIAREMRDTYTRLTGHATSGTLPYMSPEQLRGAAPAAAQDVYSLAATMYECLSGHPPFWRGQIEYQIVNEEPEALTTGYGASIGAGLDKDPAKRPATCAALLGAAPAPAPAPERPAPAPQPPPPESDAPAWKPKPGPPPAEPMSSEHQLLCPGCGAELYPDDSFCSFCGLWLEPTEYRRVVCKACEAAVYHEDCYCMNCGEKPGE